jgi:seryl-tRNA synthetase
MHDIKFIESNKEYVLKNLAMRNFDSAPIELAIEQNSKRKSLISKVELAQSQIKSLSKEVGMKKRNGEDATIEMNKVHELKASTEEDDKELTKIKIALEYSLATIPNFLEDDCPIGKDESENVELRKWGTPRVFDFKVRDHVDLGESLKMLDFDAAAKMTGARFVVYKNNLARLERALANFMLDHQMDKGYEEIIPPLLVHERALYGTGQLPKFKEDLFKIEGQDWYLIPTSEVPLTNLKREEIMNSSELPQKYAGLTPCFRSEAGSHGRDTRGLIRMHQFNKVEMVNLVHPDESNKTLDEMVESAEQVLEKLNLPYRTVRLCTGDIGFGARKTFDIEVWVPSQETYREISSCSNCGDFQARRASIRFKNEGEKPQFVHTLNGSGLAVGRCFVAVLENYQNEDGSITIPDALRPYMGNIEKIEAKK